MAGRERFLSKVVVRNLPIGLDEAAFKALVGESLLQHVDYFYYVPGRPKPKATDIPTIAFLNFTTQAALMDFNAKIDGHLFMDNRGSGVACSVEYAQSQQKPKKIGGPSNRHQPKPDALQGTIEDDDHFKQFLAEISAPVAAPSADPEPAPVRGLTPLLLAIKKKDQEKFDERQNSRNKRSKKNAKKTKAVAPAAKATPKRKRNPKKNAAKKTAEPGPQFGAVKIMTSSAPASPAPASSSTPSKAQASSSAGSSTPSAADAKKRRQRRPKVKKAGGDTAPAKKTTKTES